MIESLYKLKIVSVDPLNSYRSFIGSSAITSCESAKLMQENLGEAKKSVQSLLWLRGEGAMSNLSNKTNYCFSRSPIIRQCNKRGHMIRIRGIHNILAPSFHWGPLNLIIDIFNKNMPIVQQSVGFNLNNRRRVLPQLRPWGHQTSPYSTNLNNWKIREKGEAISKDWWLGSRRSHLTLVPQIIKIVQNNKWPMESRSISQDINKYIQLSTLAVQTSFLKSTEGGPTDPLAPVRVRAGAMNMNKLDLFFGKNTNHLYLSWVEANIESIIYKVKAVDLITSTNIDNLEQVKSSEVAFKKLKTIIQKLEFNINLAKDKTDQTIARKGLENLNSYEIKRKWLKSKIGKQTLLDMKKQLNLIMKNPLNYLKKIVENNMQQTRILRLKLLNSIRNVKLLSTSDSILNSNPSVQMLIKLVIKPYLYPEEYPIIESREEVINNLYTKLKNTDLGESKAKTRPNLNKGQQGSRVQEDKKVVLEANIKGFGSKVNNDWLLKTIPIPLKYKNLFLQCIEGYSKENSSSSIFMNWTLNGLNKINSDKGLIITTKIDHNKVNLIVITNKNNLQIIKKNIEEYLRIRGLLFYNTKLKPWKFGEKIDLLGWTIQLLKPTKVNLIMTNQFKLKNNPYLLGRALSSGIYIYPSRESTQLFRDKIKSLTSLSNSRKSVTEIIKLITQEIIEWSNNFSSASITIRKNLDLFISNRFKKFLRVKFGKAFPLHFKNYFQDNNGKLKHNIAPNHPVGVGVGSPLSNSNVPLFIPKLKDLRRPKTKL